MFRCDDWLSGAERGRVARLATIPGLSRQLSWDNRMTLRDFWFSLPKADVLDSEANIEARLVQPLLRALGYADEDIESKYPVVFQEGRAGRKPEADFVCFDGPERDKSHTLLVVEAKAAGEPLPPGKAQGESYAQNLHAPLLLLTNGEAFEIWQLQISRESECILSARVADLALARGEVERYLTKDAVRGYCSTLTFKTMAEATSDFTAYESSELERLQAEPPAIARTLSQDAGGGRTELSSRQLWDMHPTGVVVLGGSGLGKTTLSRSLFRQALVARGAGRHPRVAVEASAPDLEHSGLSLLDFLHLRVSAHHPGLTLATFKDSIRSLGVSIVCDALERTSDPFQKRLTSEINLLRRDFPLSQILVLSRSTTAPPIPLPILRLLPLSDAEIRELENLTLSDGSTQHYSIIGQAAPTLNSLCRNPLLLRLVLDHWKSTHDLPQNIDELFRTWLEAVLESEPNDTVSRIHRERALTLIAQATAEVPISGARAVSLLRTNGVAESALNELIRSGAIRGTGAVLAIEHEGLADYLRAKAFADMPVVDQRSAIPDLVLASDSFLPVLLMSQLVDQGARDAMWRKLASSRFDIYLDALRFRLDTTAQLEKLVPTERSLLFMTDLLRGVEEPLDGFFPTLRPSVTDDLTDQTDRPLSIIGAMDGRFLSYQIRAQPPGAPRIAVGTPEFPGTIRGVDLMLSGYRADSARVVGMSLLKESLYKAVKTMNVDGGSLWANDRLIARVRVLAERYDYPLSPDDQLDHIESIIRPYAGKILKEGVLIGSEQFSMQSLLEDAAVLRGAGHTALDPWWARLGWSGGPHETNDADLACILDEQYRRAQLIYSELAGASLSQFKSELIYYPILPLRWDLTVVRREPFNRTFVIYPRWKPVKDWADAGADVRFAESAPEAYAPWEPIQAALAALGRPGNVPEHGGFTTHFGFDGESWTGYLNGATPATNKALSWMRKELDKLFRNLPSSSPSLAS